jgi:hypothetical protein
MAKKSGRLLLLGVIAAATAAGVYHYLSKKDQDIEEYDDFDDLDAFDEDIPDPEPEDKKAEDDKKNYINLDTAKYIVNDAAAKAKDAIGKASKKIQETINEALDSKEDESDDDADFEMSETVVDEDAADAESAEADVAAEDDKSEDFFDDDEA